MYCEANAMASGRPAFQPCVESGVPGLGRKPRRTLTPELGYTVAGLFLLGMLSFIPCWNAAAMFGSSAFVTFVGDYFPRLIVASCFSVLLLFVAATALFFAAAPVHMQTDQVMMMMGSSFITLMGVLFILIASPLQRAGANSARDLWENCQFGARSHKVFAESNRLQLLRSQESCASQDSIESCPGFDKNATPAVFLLRDMERDFFCSGFCHRQALAAEALSTRDTKASLPPAPATLFDPIPRNASCDGMAAREISAMSEVVSEQLFAQGTVLVIIALLAGCLRMLGVCRHKMYVERESYGTLERNSTPMS
jgi:hypothetical protein